MDQEHEARLTRPVPLAPPRPEHRLVPVMLVPISAPYAQLAAPVAVPPDEIHGTDPLGDLRAATTARRQAGQRRHRAPAGRILAVGVSTSVLFAGVAAFASSSHPAPVSPPEPDVTEPDVTDPPRIVYVDEAGNPLPLDGAGQPILPTAPTAPTTAAVEEPGDSVTVVTAPAPPSSAAAGATTHPNSAKPVATAPRAPRSSVAPVTPVASTSPAVTTIRTVPSTAAPTTVPRTTTTKPTCKGSPC